MEFISTNLVQARRLGGEVVGVNLLRRARKDYHGMGYKWFSV